MYGQLRRSVSLTILITGIATMGCGGSSATHHIAETQASDTVDLETEETASQFMGQAGMALSEGDEEEALENYLEAARIYDRSGQVVVERAEAHFLAAELAYKQGNNDMALKEYDTAVQIYLRFKGNSQIKAANALNNMGTIYKTRHDSGKAKNCWEQALKIYKEAPAELQSHSNMATIEQNISDLAEGF